MKLIGIAARIRKHHRHMYMYMYMVAAACMLSQFVSLPASSAVNDWQKFTPHNFEFSIYMPQPVETEEVHKGSLTASVFKSAENGSVYSVSVLDLKRVPIFDRYFKEVIAGLKQKGSIASAIKNESGSGWKGKRCVLSKDGEQVGVCLVALGNSTSVVYTLNVRSPSNPVDADQFFQSFVVYPEEAVEAHGQPKGGLIDSSIRSYGLFAALALAAFAALLWAAVVAIRKKKSAAKKNEPAD